MCFEAEGACASVMDVMSCSCIWRNVMRWVAIWIFEVEGGLKFAACCGGMIRFEEFLRFCLCSWYSILFKSYR